MAGEDTSFLGEAFPAAGTSVGFLHQEPALNPNKDVLGNVEEGVAAEAEHPRQLADAHVPSVPSLPAGLASPCNLTAP